MINLSIGNSSFSYFVDYWKNRTFYMSSSYRSLPDKITLLTILALLAITTRAQHVPPAARSGYQPGYALQLSGKIITGKNFYWLTVVDRSPAIKKILLRDQLLESVHEKLVNTLRNHITDTCTWAASLVTDFRFTPEDEKAISNELGKLYHDNKNAASTTCSRSPASPLRLLSALRFPSPMTACCCKLLGTNCRRP